MATEYGTRLKAARNHAGLTQKKAEKVTGIAQSTISTAERLGHGSADTPVYAQAYGVDALWLATGQGQMLPATQSGVIPPDYKQNPHLAHASKAPAAIKSEDLAQALQVLANALANADPVYRNGAKAYLEGLCDSPDRTDLIDLICHTLDPPASHKDVPETGAMRRTN